MASGMRTAHGRAASRRAGRRDRGAHEHQRQHGDGRRFPQPVHAGAEEERAARAGCSGRARRGRRGRRTPRAVRGRAPTRPPRPGARTQSRPGIPSSLSGSRYSECPSRMNSLGRCRAAFHVYSKVPAPVPLARFVPDRRRGRRSTPRTCCRSASAAARPGRPIVSMLVFLNESHASGPTTTAAAESPTTATTPAIANAMRPAWREGARSSTRSRAVSAPTPMLTTAPAASSHATAAPSAPPVACAISGALRTARIARIPNSAATTACSARVKRLRLAQNRMIRPEDRAAQRGARVREVRRRDRHRHDRQRRAAPRHSQNRACALHARHSALVMPAQAPTAFQ